MKRHCILTDSTPYMVGGYGLSITRGLVVGAMLVFTMLFDSSPLGESFVSLWSSLASSASSEAASEVAAGGVLAGVSLSLESSLDFASSFFSREPIWVSLMKFSSKLGVEAFNVFCAKSVSKSQLEFVISSFIRQLVSTCLCPISPSG